MTRRRALWLSGIASLVLLAVEVVFDLRMQRAGGHGIIDFELAGKLAYSRRIVEFWGHDGRRAARLSLGFDYGYLIAYGAFWALAVAAIRDMARRRGWRRFARIAAVLVALPVAAAAFDAVENAGLLLALGRHGGATAPRVAAICATTKFALIDVAILFVIVALVRRGLERRRATTAIGLAVVAAAVAAVVVDGVIASNRTAAADARAGGIVHLPGGDLHVIDEGSSRAPALVLIHGWGGSTAWWETAGRMLARDHRVIRVDLLGFGASSKPARGYGMDNQARLVLGALRRMGVTRAVVAGHSLGGAVAVAMAERDPGLVRGIVVLDSPPVKDAGAPSLSDRSLFTPVIGAAGFDLLPDAVFKSGLRPGFARGFHVPERFVADLRRATYTSFTRSAEDHHDFLARRPLDLRMAATGRPLLVIYGRRDRLVDPHVLARWRDPGARIVGVAGSGHSPQVERPRVTSQLIAGFADTVLSRPAIRPM
jgi:pimeloyl-ACP methyl ester carboxylesterase